MSTSGYNTVTVFFDESGKFKDHKVISFGGVVAYNENFIDFANEWGRLLYRNGLPALSAKNVLNARRPLSRKNRRVGIKERIEDLAPFVACIRKHLQVIIGVTVDVRAFKKLPAHFFQTYGADPVFVAFARSMLEVIGFTPERDKVSFVCDDEEEVAVHVFRLYRRVKRIFPRARNKLVAITFADDKSLFALQAADLVSSIMRLEAGRRMLRAKYDYLPLFKALSKSPERNEKLWNVQIAFGDKRMLTDLCDSLSAERKRVQTET
jgi:Protein of unknown function (DUF3800)